MAALKSFESPHYAPGYFSRYLEWTFVLIDTKNVRTKFEVRTLPVPEIIGVLQKFGESLDLPMLFILPNF